MGRSSTDRGVFRRKAQQRLLELECRANNRRAAMASRIASGVAMGLYQAGGKPQPETIARIAVEVLEQIESKLCRFKEPIP